MVSGHGSSTECQRPPLYPGILLLQIMAMPATPAVREQQGGDAREKGSTRWDFSMH